MSDPLGAGLKDGGESSNMGTINRILMKEHMFLTTELSTLKNKKTNKIKWEGPTIYLFLSIPITVPILSPITRSCAQTQVKFKLLFRTCKLSRDLVGDCMHPRPRECGGRRSLAVLSRSHRPCPAAA